MAPTGSFRRAAPLAFAMFFIIIAGGAASSATNPTNITWEAERLLELKSGLTQTEMLSQWLPSDLGGVCRSWQGVACSDSNTTVTGLNFTAFNVSGELTSPLCDLPNLAELHLRSNTLTQEFPAFLLHSCTQLLVLDLSLNFFFGHLPANISASALRNLQIFNMEGNSFTGPIPPDLGNLLQLQLLRLRGNTLSGPIPPELGRLSMLRILDLSYGVSGAGEIPQDMANLTSLQNLDMAQCGLTGSIPQWLGNLSHLWFINLPSNNLLGPIPPSLADLSNLTELYLYNNSLRGPLPPFSNLTFFRVFQAHYNKLSGVIPDGFSSLLALENLLLAGNNLSGSIPNGLPFLPALSTFVVFDNFLSGTISSEWGLHSKLFQFDISDNDFAGSFPPHLCNGNGLAYLGIKNNHINGSIPAEYGKCESTLRFIANGNELSGSVPSGLWTLPSIQVINLQNNDLSGTITIDEEDASVKYGSLQSIFIDSNGFEGPIPSTIDRVWFNISKLTASQNKLSGPLPSQIGKLNQLAVLDLSMNSLSGEIPSSIGGCDALTSLSLSRNNLSGPIPATLGQIPNLNYLNLSMNDLNGSIPYDIAKSTYVLFDVAYNDLSGTVPGPLLEDFGARNFEGNPKLCLSAESCRPVGTEKGGGGKPVINRKLLVPVVIASVCAVVLYICIFQMVKVIRKRTRPKVEAAVMDWMVVPFQKPQLDERRIYQRLKDSEVIGMGGSGMVYKVRLLEGNQVVAVKELISISSKNQGDMWGSHGNEGLRMNIQDKNAAFKAEMETLGKARHKNIVNLICACACKEAKLLVYEYMCNGSLGDVLHKSFRNELLSWATRFKIALGAAEGLAYLHHDCVPPILHRDIKSNNILLDPTFQAKLADFGVAKSVNDKAAMTRVVGSIGYIAPEYAYTLKVDEKSDVYSFGVVLLEILTGRSPSGKEMDSDKMDLVKWVGQMLAQSKQDFYQLLDCRLEVTDDDKESLANVLVIALRCTCTLPRQHPSMLEVVEFLRRAIPMAMLGSQPHQTYLWHDDKTINTPLIS